MNCTEAELVNKLREIKSLLAPHGKIYVRTHPWCSRHGTHLYRQINKAYMHMIFTNEEIEAMGYKQEKIRKILTPMIDYSTLFSRAGLKIHKGPNAVKEGVEQFFIKHKILAQRIINNFRNSAREDLRNGKFPTGPMEFQFVDYILT